MEKIKVRELIPGADVKGKAVVKIRKSMFKYADGFAFSLILADESGDSIEYTFWGKNKEETEKIFAAIKDDSVLFIEGKVIAKGKRKRINSSIPPKILESKEGEFVKSKEIDAEKLYAELIEKVEKFENEKLKEFLLSVLQNKEIAEAFKKYPGSIQIHHNWFSGLLQHSYEVVRICELVAELFPELDKELMVSGALLHDIGKIKEIEITTRIKGTKKGQLKGHIVQGIILVSKLMEQSNLDEETKDKLLHIIVSHHGTKENGSPKEPMTAEAFAVYLADLMSSQLAHIIEFIKENKELTEDEFMYHYREQRNILLK